MRPPTPRETLGMFLLGYGLATAFCAWVVRQGHAEGGRIIVQQHHDARLLGVDAFLSQRVKNELREQFQRDQGGI